MYPSTMGKKNDTLKRVLKIIPLRDIKRAAMKHSADLPFKSMNLTQEREAKGGSPELEEEINFRSWIQNTPIRYICYLYIYYSNQ